MEGRRAGSETKTRNTRDQIRAPAQERFAEEATFAPNDRALLLFWSHAGEGNAVLRVTAMAHIVAGMMVASAGIIVGLTSNGSAVLLVGGIGLFVVLIGGLALLLARSLRRGANELARQLLPLVDGAACIAALLLLGDRGIMGIVFLAPVIVAVVLLSWRSGAAFAALDVGAYAAISAVRSDSTVATISTWMPQTLVLAGTAFVITTCTGAFVHQTSNALNSARQRGEVADQQLRNQGREQQRLLDGLTLLEETLARLERERILVNQQIAEVASVTQHLSAGDLAAIRNLRPGMYGPLDALAGALARLGQQMTGILGLRQQIQTQQQTFEHLAQVVRELERLVIAAEASLRELSLRANELVADVQRVERDSSNEFADLHQPHMLQVLRGVEQRAMAQASNTTMLGTRLTQLQAHVAELGAQVERIRQMAPSVSNASNSSYSGALGPRPSPSNRAGFEAPTSHPTEPFDPRNGSGWND